MIIQIEGKNYSGVDIKDLSLRHTMALQRELVVSNISSAKTLNDVHDLLREFSTLSNRERENHPEGTFLTAVAIWAARVSAGEDVSLLEAVDVPLTAIKFVAEPTDRLPGKAKAGTGAARAKKK